MPTVDRQDFSQPMPSVRKTFLVTTYSARGQTSHMQVLDVHVVLDWTGLTHPIPALIILQHPVPHILHNYLAETILI